MPGLLRTRALKRAISDESKASQRVLEKLGFQNDIVLRNYTINKGQLRDTINNRPYRTSDVDDFLNIYGGDNRVTRFSRWNSFTSKEEALFYINTCTCIPHPYCKSICINKCSIRLS
ncbi:hypothetical protein G4B88_003082 [Cannabis sativa]|uniref:Uncharacterized protein n=1 Tax=Cannabis sativa TaxID=3483 RepID=A0A7J6H495_CANSA|nr:hypothetical protein G4B88_003082 [Cannabis sativa]